MSQRIVALTGISGVGKTTLLNRLAERLDFQHVTGGSLIAATRDADPRTRDAIRHADLDENQRLLIEGFALIRDPNAKLIIMDGHVVIDDGTQLLKIPHQVFSALGISEMVHLEAEPEQIAANRLGDTSRARPAHSIEILSQHQQLSRAHAIAVAKTLGISCHSVGHAHVDALAKSLTG